jgi:hypothetical protein
VALSSIVVEQSALLSLSVGGSTVLLTLGNELPNSILSKPYLFQGEEGKATNNEDNVVSGMMATTRTTKRFIRLGDEFQISPIVHGCWYIG